MRNFFDSNALWLSMLIGALGYKIFLPLKPSLPWLIFFMLFFTFCKVNPKDLRLHKWHWVVLFLQIALSLAAYAITYLLTGSRFMAQGLMLCFVMPTATAAPIIAGKMGGSIQNLTTFTLLSNFATAIIVPVLQRWTKKEFVLSRTAAQIPFYLWVASIVVLSAVVTNTTILNFQSQIANILILLVLSFFACLLQFGLGKLIGYYLPAPSKGKDYQDVLINPAAAPKTMEGVSSITAGQAFGQKNTSLGVWMAQTYLHPLAALGAAAYIIWQNLFNSVQLFVVAHKK